MKICRLFNRSYRSIVRDDGLLRNLDLIALSAAIGTILFSNTGGAAFTGYASALGAGEFMFGLISALPILGSLVQLYVSFIMEKTGNRKLLFMIGGLFSRFMWLLIAFIPLFIPERFGEYRIWVLLVMITMAAMGASFVGVTHTTMVAEVVPLDIRGRYMTTRQRVMTLVSMLTGFGSSFILDQFAGLSGYTVVFCVASLAGLCDILMYTRFRFPETKRTADGFSLAKGFRQCFHERKTRDYIIFFCAWSFAVNISAPFFTKYSIDILKLSFKQIIIFGQIGANIMSLLVVKRWGRFIDRYGCVPLMLVTGTITGLLVLVWMPATIGNVIPLMVFNLIGGLFWCANEASAVNMQLSHTPDIGRPLALAIYAVVTSLSSAAAFIIGGAILEGLAPAMAAARLTVFGTPFDHYKLLFAVATVLRLSAILILLPRVWNEKGLKTKDVYVDIWRRAQGGVKMLRVAFIAAGYRRKLQKQQGMKMQLPLPMRHFIRRIELKWMNRKARK